MGGQPTARASIRDVAVRAGVSRQTVSRVINDAPGTTPETAARVRRAIADLDYRPNRAARVLASSRHRTIGLVTTAPTMFGPSSIALAIERASRERQYSVATVTALSEHEDDLAAAIDELIAHGVDGLVLIAPQQVAFDVIGRRTLGLPTLTLQWRGGLGATVYLDQRAGAIAATEHLLELGHRRILHLAGPVGWAEVDERAAGYRKAMAAAGAEPLPLVHGDWSADSGYRTGLSALRAGGITAVFASNDQMAVGLLHAARELGIEVPGDLSVVGFDDIPEARHAAPPLTTVRQDFAELGRAAIDRLVDLVQGREGGPNEVGGRPTLLIRSSTARL